MGRSQNNQLRAGTGKMDKMAYKANKSHKVLISF